MITPYTRASQNKETVAVISRSVDAMAKAICADALRLVPAYMNSLPTAPGSMPSISIGGCVCFGERLLTRCVV